MERIKNVAETVILISSFTAFSVLSMFIVTYDNKLYIQLFAVAAMAFFGKSAVLIFCRAVGLIPGHKIQIYSYQATALCICLFTIAIIVKCIS